MRKFAIVPWTRDLTIMPCEMAWAILFWVKGLAILPWKKGLAILFWGGGWLCCSGRYSWLHCPECRYVGYNAPNPIQFHCLPNPMSSKPILFRSTMLQRENPLAALGEGSQRVVRSTPHQKTTLKKKNKTCLEKYIKLACGCETCSALRSVAEGGAKHSASNYFKNKKHKKNNVEKYAKLACCYGVFKSKWLKLKS